MKLVISALFAGLIFGLGIAISGMGNPSKVLNFFDPFGTWDPSLGFVMMGELVIMAIGYRLIFGRRVAPRFDTAFHIPEARAIDRKLIGCVVLFGVGWGIAGFYPGGAIPALGFAPWPTALFVISMGAGMLIARWLQRQPRGQFA